VADFRDDEFFSFLAATLTDGLIFVLRTNLPEMMLLPKRKETTETSGSSLLEKRFLFSSNQSRSG